MIQAARATGPMSLLVVAGIISILVPIEYIANRETETPNVTPTKEKLLIIESESEYIKIKEEKIITPPDIAEDPKFKPEEHSPQEKLEKQKKHTVKDDLDDLNTEE